MAGTVPRGKAIEATTPAVEPPPILPPTGASVIVRKVGDARPVVRGVLRHADDETGVAFVKPCARPLVPVDLLRHVVAVDPCPPRRNRKAAARNV